MTTPAEGPWSWGSTWEARRSWPRWSTPRTGSSAAPRSPHPAREGADALREALIGVGREALEAAGVAADQLAAVGIGSPGPLDVDRGRDPLEPEPRRQGLPARRRSWRQAFGKPVLVQNDVRVGGYGEYKLGAGRGYRRDRRGVRRHRDRRLPDPRRQDRHRGDRQRRRDRPHRRQGRRPECGCGRRGCLEALASRTAITRRIHKAIKKGPRPRSREASRGSTPGSRARNSPPPTAPATRSPCTRSTGPPVPRPGPRRPDQRRSGPEIIIIGGGVTEAIGAPFVDLVRTAARAQAHGRPRPPRPHRAGRARRRRRRPRRLPDRPRAVRPGLRGPEAVTDCGRRSCSIGERPCSPVEHPRIGNWPWAH